VRKQRFCSMFIGLMVLVGNAACGTDTVEKKDAAKTPVIPKDAEVVQAACDPTDLSEEGVSLCIINSPGGGGTIIPRVDPVPSSACK